MRWVLHLDMDAFYASVEQLTRPTVRGRPVLVGGLGPRGVVAAASYESRRYGARSAMSMGQARRAVPAAVVLPPRFGLYHAVSERVFDVLRAVSPVVEHVSLDEAFLEPPEFTSLTADEVAERCARLRADVRDAVGLPCSVGAGSGKQLAKIASELAKPDGLLVVPHGNERDVLEPLPVRSLWGIGPVAEARLHKVGVTTVGQLAALDRRDAALLLGETVGSALHALARGVDTRPVASRVETKSISAESTFDLDLADIASIDSATTAMATAAHRRLLAADLAARTVTVKVRGADFSLVTRSESLPAGTTDEATLVGIARRLVRVALPPSAVRLIGVGYSGLDGEAQEALFGLDARTAEGPLPELPPPPPASTGPRPWQAGDDVTHPEHGHGWVQGAGHGRVTVRFETRWTGPGRARTFAADDPLLTRAEPITSWAEPGTDAQLSAAVDPAPTVASAVAPALAGTNVELSAAVDPAPTVAPVGGDAELSVARGSVRAMSDGDTTTGGGRGPGDVREAGVPRYLPGVPCWVELRTPDPGKTAAYYAGVLGWEVADARAAPAADDGAVLVARLGGADVAGFAAAVPADVGGEPAAATGGAETAGVPGGPGSRWLTYVAVADLDAAAARVRDAGGTVDGSVDVRPGAGRGVLCADPAGAPFALWEADGWEGAAVVNAPGSWNWSDVATGDADGAAAFYGAVFGWVATSLDLGGDSATMLRLPGYGDHLAVLDPSLRERHAAGHVPAGFSDAVGWLTPAPPGSSAEWQVTFSVADVDAAVDRVTAHGGAVVVPAYDAGPSRVAVVADPLGVRFTVSSYNPG